MMLRTIENIMAQYGGTPEDAQRYIDLREEGYSQYQALLMAGLDDPIEDPSEQTTRCSGLTAF